MKNIIKEKKQNASNDTIINDENILNDILETEKNMSVNMTTALNEASNEELYKKLYEIFELIKNKQRLLFELAYSKGWYELETAPKAKMNKEYNKLNKKLSEINN